jgi:hypothetical protein
LLQKHNRPLLAFGKILASLMRAVVSGNFSPLTRTRARPESGSSANNRHAIWHDFSLWLRHGWLRLTPAYSVKIVEDAGSNLRRKDRDSADIISVLFWIECGHGEPDG